MSLLHLVAILAAGFAAGTINTIVGSGSLITFPTLLVLGYPPLTANVSNNIGLVPGGVSGSYGYRHELAGRARTLRRLAPLSFLGSILGATLLLVLPPAAFKAIVPALIVIALVLVLVGPRLQRRAAERRGEEMADPAWHHWALGTGTFVAGAYGGYFGAAQGVLLMGLFSALSAEPLQRLNAYKNVLSAIVNGVAALMFVLFARGSIDWVVVLLIAIGSFLGGLVGARIGQRIPPAALRGLIVLIGVVAIAKLVFFP
jgi:uncharacterized protein